MSISSRIIFKPYGLDNFFSYIKIFQSFLDNGWDYEINNLTQYNPLGDKDGLIFKVKKFEIDEIIQFIHKKISANEIFEFELIKKSLCIGEEHHGIDLRQYQDGEYYVRLEINRKITSEGFTDVNWYFSEINKVVHDAGYKIEHIRYEEHV